MVRTTGNQSVTGIKRLNSVVINTYGISRVTPTTHCIDLAKIPANAGTSYTFSVLLDARFDFSMDRVSITIDADGNAASVAVTDTGLHVLNSTRQIKFGGRVADGSLILSAVTESGNTNIGATVLSCNASGYTSIIDNSVYGTVNAISGLTGFVQET